MGIGEDAKALLTPAAWGFSAGEYSEMARGYPAMVASRAFKRKTAEQMEAEAESKGPLKRTLGPFGLTCVGVGLMLGAGIFIAPGEIAVEYTGAAVCVSYLIAAVSAFLSCFCYSEFAVSMPLAGAAYNYIAASLGEFLAWVVTSNLLFEYILADAAVIRGFAPYFATLIGKPNDFFLYEAGGYTLDWLAFSLTLLITACLARGSRESHLTNTIITVVHVLVMVFIIVAGLTKADTANLTPFFPEDKPDAWKNVFNGATVAFFSFIGFDAVATAAEEVKDPAKHMPVGIIGSLSLVTIVYVAMSLVLCMMVPVAAIDPRATFAAAFDYVGLGWATHIVALGALLGIVTGTMMGIYAPARILTSTCREGMLPPFLAWVGPRQTPWVATWFVGIAVAVISLLTDFAALADMVSIGTFVVFLFVAVGLIWRRCHVPGETSRGGLVSLSLHMAALLGFSLAFTIVWTMPSYNYGGAMHPQQVPLLASMAALAAATAVSMFFFCKPVYEPQGYCVPLYPFIPCASVFINTFLLGQCKPESFVRFAFWTLAVTALYLLYGVFAAQNKDNVRALEAVEAPPSRKNDFPSSSSSSSSASSHGGPRKPQAAPCASVFVIADDDSSLGLPVSVPAPPQPHRSAQRQEELQLGAASLAAPAPATNITGSSAPTAPCATIAGAAGVAGVAGVGGIAVGGVAVAAASGRAYGLWSRAGSGISDAGGSDAGSSCAGTPLTVVELTPSRTQWLAAPAEQRQQQRRQQCDAGGCIIELPLH